MQAALTVQFSYKSIPARCRNARTTTGVYAGRIEVKEVSAASAPLLCEVEVPVGRESHWDDKKQEYVTETAWCPYRIHGDQVWTRVLGESTLPTLAIGGFREHETSQLWEDAARAKLADRFSNFCATHRDIGGELYELTAEPALVLLPDRRGYGDSLEITVSTHPDGDWILRLDETATLDAIMARVIATEGMSGHNEEPVPIIRRHGVRLHRPDLLQRPSHRYHLTKRRLLRLNAAFNGNGHRPSIQECLGELLDQPDVTALPAGTTVDSLQYLLSTLELTRAAVCAAIIDAREEAA